MKTIIRHGLLGAALLLCAALHAQNVQFHYDFGRAAYDRLGDRPLWTTTVEMFKPDKWGSTFFFVDMDYKSDGVASFYWEISRELKFWEGPAMNAEGTMYSGTRSRRKTSRPRNRLFSFATESRGTRYAPNRRIPRTPATGL